jgi:hypothetical protein
MPFIEWLKGLGEEQYLCLPQRRHSLTFIGYLNGIEIETFGYSILANIITDSEAVGKGVGCVCVEGNV